MNASTPALKVMCTFQPPEHVALPIKVVDATAITFDIEVEPPYRGAGLGNAALRELVAVCDQLGVRILIYAEPEDPEMQSLKSLVAWYVRHDFEPMGPERKGRRMLSRRPANDHHIPRV